MQMERNQLQIENRKSLMASGKTVIVLDDDPTGTQTVYDIPILTSWEDGEIEKEIIDGTPVFYILTNSRALDAKEAVKINRQIMASIPHPENHFIVSRSDSTLRGHYPLETDIISEFYPKKPGILIIPFFEEGGRITEDDIHYVRDGENRIPAAETPFAKDSVFGFTNSNLRDWVEEKTKGRISRDDVLSIFPGDLEHTIDLLDKVQEVGIVNATSMAHIEILVAAIHRSKKNFLFRTAGSFVRGLAGLPAKPMLEKSEMLDPQGKGGLVVVGSYVPKTTQQLSHLISQFDSRIVSIELKIDDLNWEECLEFVKKALSDDKVAVVYTSREIRVESSISQNLIKGREISMALVNLVKNLSIRPGFLIAKGGVTSSDVATEALGIKRATVIGNVIPGVPVWRSEGCHAFVVFPGNVGGTESMKQAVERLME